MSKEIVKKGSDWQPIETAPRDGTRILVCFGDSKTTVVRWHSYFFIGHWTVYVVQNDSFLKWLKGPKIWLALAEEPKYWMLLPEPPKE